MSEAFQSEYDAARRRAVLLPPTERAFLRLTGSDRAVFLHGQVSQNVLSLTSGQSARAALLSTTGHILADLWIHARPDALLIETDLECITRLHETLELYLITEDVQIEDVSADFAVLAVRGPEAGKVSVGIEFRVDLEDGFNLYMLSADLTVAREALLAAGVVPIGTSVAETLRIEDGLPLWGKELVDAMLLPEAEIEDRVSYTKGCYVGQEIVARLHARGHVNRSLRGVLLSPDAPVPHPGATLHLPQDAPNGAGREVGRITSAALSPRFENRPLALAYVRREAWDNGMSVDVHIPQPDGTQFVHTGTVQIRPFVSSAG